jgi:1A family penicillin-binding protein
MTFQRTGKRLLVSSFPKNPIFWVVFLLENVGRASYKTIFWLLKLCFKPTFPFSKILTKLIRLPLICFWQIGKILIKSFLNINLIISWLIQLIKLLIGGLLNWFRSQLVFITAKFRFHLWIRRQKKLTKLKFPNFSFNRLPRIKMKIPGVSKSVSWLKLRSRLIQKRVKKVAPTKPKVSLHWAIRISNFALVALPTFAVLLFIFYFLFLKDLPSPTTLVSRPKPVSTKIYDRNGVLLYTIYNGNQNRSLVTLDQIPSYLKDATIAIEDKDFYHHQGFSIPGIARALERNIFNHAVEGGSTITQQLVKNALLSPEKTMTRKIKEFILAMEVELLYSKDEILQLYFNEIPYGGTAYGVEAASKTYFGKSVKDLDLAEAALLAGLPAAPTQFSPFGANPQLAYVRQKETLELMVKDGYITEDEKNKALAEKIVFAPQTTDIKAPHFVMYVKDLLVKKYGQRVVEEGGLEVYTSLDLKIQQMAEDQVKQEVDKLTAFNVGNGAALITNPKTGEILAMVGSRDYFDQAHDGNVNVTTSQRQPGSSIKVVNYAVALQSGYSPSSIISDTPIAYKNAWETYAPVNYDGRYHGNITLRTALASSYNIPAVKVLASYGVDKMVAMGKLLGITTWEDSSRFGLSLTLGGGEVKMTDMAVVYGTLANNGQKVVLHPILKVVNYQGKVLEAGDCEKGSATVAAAADDKILCQPQQVVPASVAYLLSDILSDNAARTPAFGPNSALVIPGNQVAVKTGTTNEKRDNWTIGYTPNVVVAVWVGNNDNSPMSAIASGITGASPIWHNIMVNLLKNQPVSHFDKPQDLVAIQVCAVNGLLPCEGCPTKTEYFLPGNEPKLHCDPEIMKKQKEEEEKKTKEEEEKQNQQGQILNGISTQ